MKTLQWKLLTVLLIFCHLSWATDSTRIVIANSLRQQMLINRQNNSNGTPDKNNYVLSINSEKKEINDPLSKQFKNGGEAFWKGMDETLINQKIIAAKESFGDIGYYVVVASIFKYADVNFDADQQEDWETIKNKQKAKGGTPNSSDDSKTYFSKLIGYVNKELNVPQNGKYLINYYFTVFTYDATTSQFIISYKSYVAYSSESNLAGKTFPAFNSELINDFKADKSKWINKNIESDAAVIAQINKDNLDGTGNGNAYVIDYSKDGTGHSSFSQDQLATLGKNMGHIEKAFGEKIKVYLLNACNTDYDKIKAQAAADPATNKIIVTEDCDHHKINMQHSFSVPQWILDVFPDYTGACTDDYVNIGLDALHNTEEYKTDGNANQTIDEIQTITYRTLFGSLYCATSEESVQHASITEQYVAGALHEVIATVDVDELITGLIKMGKGIISSNAESQEAFYNDVKQTIKDLASGTPITNQELLKHLMPPSLRNDVKGITTAINISKQLASFYFTGCNNYQFKNGTVGPICAYRNGQITVMVVPIILTGGEWAFAKAAKMATEVATEIGSLVQKAAIIKVSEQTTADIITLLKDAEQTGKTVVQDANKIVITQEDKLIATIEKDGGEVQILKGARVQGAVGLIDDALEEGLKTHPNFSKLGLSINQLDEFKTLLNTKMPNSAADIFNGLKSHLDAGTSFENMQQMISGLKNNWSNFSDGSKWVFNYTSSSKGLTQFGGKKIRFELPTETELGLRRIDIADVTNPSTPLLFEFKSVQTPFNSTYATQFMKDINVVDDLSQIKWLYDGNKVSSLNKADYINLLKSNSGFNSTKIRSIFSKYAEDLGLSAITNQTQLESFLGSNNSWFTDVFKVVQL